MDFNRNFDINSMLHEDMVWFSKQADLPINEFLKIASKIELRQQDWTGFWNRIRAYRLGDSELVKCEIRGREKTLTGQEFEYAKHLLGDPEEVSNCCGASVAPHNANDHTSRCMDCKEGCEVIYVF